MYDHKDYKAISSKIEFLWTQKRELNREQIQAIWDMQALTHGLDVVRAHMHKLEEASQANDKVLEKFTGDDSESWSGTYSKSLDLIREKLVDQCVIIANRRVDVEVVSTQIKSLNIERDALGDKLREEFHAKEEAVAS
jgi:hypothetical protein